MARGIIYVLINKSLRGMVKIGKTSRSAEDRASELSSTSLPNPFLVAYDREVSDCEKVEKLIHDRLSQYRVNDDREFFKLPTSRAIDHVIEICSEFPVSNENNDQNNIIEGHIVKMSSRLTRSEDSEIIEGDFIEIKENSNKSA
jgi:hypothetical protein